MPGVDHRDVAVCTPACRPRLHVDLACLTPGLPATLLQELEATQLDEAMLSETAPVPAHKIPAASLPAMPSAPTTKAQPAAAAKTPEELELEALQAEMAL